MGEELGTERRVDVRRLGEARYGSPLPLGDFGGGASAFVSDGQWVRRDPEVGEAGMGDERGMLFEKAGPRERLYFDPGASRAAIVTCGGLCPGLNSVIRSLYITLSLNYGVREVLGIRYGYRGLNGAVCEAPVVLSLSMVSAIHKDGGTFLGSSRGPQPVGAMVDYLMAQKINMLFCIGGDGTMRGAHAIAEETIGRGLPISVIGIPKTIDNDILYADRSFGLVTAVERSMEVIHLAHCEAKGVMRGIGLVKLMGRESGFIAAWAALASQEANFVLVPEAPFELFGERGFLKALERRMSARGHAVIAVAEGAGQDLFAGEPAEYDRSGNKKPHDIGPRLRDEIRGYFDRLGDPIDIKYIDPSYLIRSGPANCEDNLLCGQLGRDAAHAGLSGRTDLVVNRLNHRFVHVPIGMAVSRKNKIDPCGELWQAVLAATGQPHRFGG